MVALLSSTYFGPIQWYQKLHRYDECVVERYDSFIKQTYRNRCIIAATQGRQILTVPTERTTGPSALMKDIRISDHGNWRHLHWNTLCSAYGESPFFDYYQDDIRPFFEKRWEYLLDFNMEITRKVCELLDVRPNIRLSDEFTPVSAVTSPLTFPHQGKTTDDIDDFREVIRPKHPGTDDGFEPPVYYQVYREKNGFLPNLSILDLLFNEGNEAICYL